MQSVLVLSFAQLSQLGNKEVTTGRGKKMEDSEIRIKHWITKQVNLMIV